MFLSDTTLRALMEDGSLQITPPVEDKNIRPQGIRLHLDHTLIHYAPQRVDPTKDMDLRYETIDIAKEPFILKPQGFVLGSTREMIKTPRHIFALLDGRSTLARLGLTVHITAAVADGLYEEPRAITLEIFNASNMEIVLSHKMAIGALLFAELDQPVQQEAQSQYRHQKGAQPANLKDQFG